jgi:hypothetical protein
VFSEEHELLARDPRRLRQLQNGEEGEHVDSESHVSVASSISASFFSSPRENPQENLKKVDLVLDAFDLHRYLIDLFTESKPHLSTLD